MEEERVSAVRDSTRNLLKQCRRLHRDEESDCRRAIKEISISAEDIASIGNKLKTKSAVTLVDLKTLQNGLLEDAKYIEVFLNMHGALRGLVRELTGVDQKKMYLAAACCCNLALGDTRSCTAVAKAAGSYLVASLDNLALDLAVTCAWTLGNLAGSSDKVCGILSSQGALAKLSEPHPNEELQSASISALLQFAYQMKDELLTHHLQKILQTLSKLKLTEDSAHLLFVLSCHDHFAENVTGELLDNLLKHLNTSLDQYNTQTKLNYVLLYIVRTLANCHTMYVLIFNYCTNNYDVFESFKIVLNRHNIVLNESLFWLLGNLLKCSGNETLFVSLLN